MKKEVVVSLIVLLKSIFEEDKSFNFDFILLAFMRDVSFSLIKDPGLN